MGELKSRPMCGVCGKPVERFLEEEGHWNASVRFIAFCHGGREVIEVAEEVLMVCKSLEFGIAFRVAGRLPPVTTSAGPPDGSAGA